MKNVWAPKIMREMAMASMVFVLTTNFTLYHLNTGF